MSIAVTAATVMLFVGVRGRRDFWDFEVYRTAGIRALAGEPLYRADDGHYQFKYWPAFAMAMTPMSLLPPEAAKFVWFGLSIGLLIYYLTRAARLLPQRRSSERWVIGWTLVLTMKFIVKELVNGQTNVLLGVLVLLAAMAVERQRPLQAGALIAVAAVVKPYALLLLPWVAVSSGVGALATAVGALGAAWLLPVLLYGWAGNLALTSAWYATVTSTTAPNLLFPENISFAAMWAKWIGSGPLAAGLAGASGIAVLVLAAVVWLRRLTVGRPAFLEVSLLLLLMPLVSPQGWDYVLLAALPGFMCLIDRFRERTRIWQGVTALGFLLTSFTIFDVLGRHLYLQAMALSVVSVGAVLLAASLADLRWRRMA